MAVKEPHPRIFGIPLGSDYPREFVNGLIQRYADRSPHEFARINIIVNTSRMRSRLIEIFAEQKCMLLPRLHLIGDLSGLVHGSYPTSDTNTFSEKFEFISLVSGLLNAQPNFAPKSSLFSLSDSLQNLMNEIVEEGVSAKNLMELNVQDQSGHWRNALEFLKIIFEYLDNQNGQIAASSLKKQTKDLTGYWSKNPLLDPVYILGSTGSRKPTLDLMAAVTQLSIGHVILPGFDFDAPQSMWSHLLSDRASEDHPQFRLAKVVETCGTDPTRVSNWTTTSTDTKRSSLISLSLRPAPVTDSWMREGPKLRNLIQATDGITLLEATSKRQEALAIALRLRQAVETGETATLITPDREISRYVSSIMSRWEITPDDSAGIPLSLTPVGRFLRETANLLGSDVKISQVFAILQHPLCHNDTETRGEHLRLTRELELYLRRYGIVSLTQDVLTEWEEKQSSGLLKQWCEWFSDCFINPIKKIEQNFDTWLQTHIKLSEKIANGSTHTSGEESRFWQGPSARPIRQIIDRLNETSETALECGIRDYLGIFKGLLAKDSLRETNETHPRVLIWGTLEARVQGADLYILAGLNEGTWPETGDSDPWLNRQMRKDAGLRLPERKIGLSAHDYQQLVCQKNVWISRSIRSNDAETVPSRWINRLLNLLNGLPKQDGPVALEHMRKRGAFWLELTDKIDNAYCEVSFEPAMRPAPCPPIDARPKSLAVTDFRTLIRDPYSIYAKHILRLRRLNPLNATPDARMRGTVIHKVLEIYFREWPSIPVDLHREKFTEILEDNLHNSVPWPSTRVFWRNRLEQVICWLIDGEVERRKNAEPIGFEASGQLEIPNLNFTIRAIADRVDQRSDGSLVIYDYKTGVVPTEKQQLFFDKQLYLLALVAENSGFAEIEPNKVFNAAFVSLGNPAKIVNAPFEKESIEEAYRKLWQLIERYQDPNQGFTARRALFKSDDFSDYDHLSRYGEWDVSHPSKKDRLQ